MLIAPRLIALGLLFCLIASSIERNGFNHDLASELIVFSVVIICWLELFPLYSLIPFHQS